MKDIGKLMVVVLSPFIVVTLDFILCSKVPSENFIHEPVELLPEVHKFSKQEGWRIYNNHHLKQFLLLISYLLTK